MITAIKPRPSESERLLSKLENDVSYLEGEAKKSFISINALKHGIRNYRDSRVALGNYLQQRHEESLQIGLISTRERYQTAIRKLKQIGDDGEVIVEEAINDIICSCRGEEGAIPFSKGELVQIR